MQGWWGEMSLELIFHCSRYHEEDTSCAHYYVDMLLVFFHERGFRLWESSFSSSTPFKRTQQNYPKEFEKKISHAHHMGQLPLNDGDGYVFGWMRWPQGLAPCRHEVFVHWSALCTSQCAWCSCSALCGGSSNLTWQQLHSDMRPGICPIYIHYDVQCHGTPSFKLFMLLGVGTFNALASNTKGLTAKGVFFKKSSANPNWLVFVFQVFWILLACPSEKNCKMSSRNSPRSTVLAASPSQKSRTCRNMWCFSRNCANQWMR